MNDVTKLETGVPVPENKIQLEDGIPLPNADDRYPFEEMQPGQSFLFPAETSQSAVHACMARTRKKYTDRKFTTRQVDVMDGDTQTKRIRVWRLK